MKKIINKNEPSNKQLHRAKEQLKSSTIIELESMSSRMDNLFRLELLGNQKEDITDIISKIDNVDMDDVMEIFEMYFKTND
jgi:predicted Zn-dependent peptidase